MKKPSLSDLDARAARALATVDERVSSQCAALAALDELQRAAQSAQPRGKTSVLATEVKRLRDERAAAFLRYHLDRAQRAADLVALRGEGERAAALAVVDDAIAYVSAACGDGGELRGLRARRRSLEEGADGKALPFFARYLEHQKR